jgi:uncharacterized protein YdaU (DUF1376 family)
MAQAPVMPLFTDALIGDTTHLSTEQFGAYVLILIATWRNNGKALPDDDKRMAHICRISVARWRKSMRPVLVEFFRDGWHQLRLEKEYERVNQLIEVRRKQGRKGGNASAARRGRGNGRAIHKEASPPKDSTSVSNLESETAREGKKNEGVNPLGRSAPLGAPPPCRKSPALKAHIRNQLMQKHGRFLVNRARPDEVAAYWTAQLGDDQIEAQRVFDAVDRQMRREAWREDWEIAA